MSLRLKLISFCLLLVVLPTAFIGVFSVRNASESLADGAMQQLVAVREAKKQSIERLFVRWEEEAEIFGGVKEVYNALGMLRDYAWGSVRAGERMDVTDEEFLGLLDYVGGAFRPFVEILGFSDAMLVSDEGRILYTYQRGDDLGEDLKAGALLSNSNLNAAWQGAMNGEITFVDVAPYAAAGEAPCMFAAAPVRDHVGVVEGVAVLRLPLARINEIMQVRTGMGESGETFLVGPDGLMRSDSVISPQTHSVVASFAGGAELEVQTKSAKAALAGNKGAWITTGLRGEETLEAYSGLSAGGLNWALIAEISTDEAFAPVHALRMGAAIAVVLLALFAAAATLGFARYEILRPLVRIKNFLDAVKSGDFKAELGYDYKAEMDDLAAGVRNMFLEVKKKLGFASGVLDGINLPCIVLNREGEISFINSQLVEFMEKTDSVESFKGMHVGEFFFGDAAKSTVSLDALEKREQLSVEMNITTDGGNVRILSVSATPVYDLDGELLGVFSLYYDLTPIREQEQFIREQAERMTQAASEAEAVASEVSSASIDLLGNTQRVSEGAQLQADRAAATAQSMQEMEAVTLQVAQNASEASKYAAEAKRLAVSGNDVVERVVGAISDVQMRAEALNGDMKRLGDRAHGIGQVITVIDDIADQTNLLALNAAIEAARAGDAGRGFAVVADEVRKLAEKTQQATSEVSEAIKGIQQETEVSAKAALAASKAVGDSTRHAEESGEALRSIVAVIETTAGQMEAIAAASEQQSATVEEISVAVEDVSEISKTTLEGMTSSSRTIEGLEMESRKLNEIIQVITS